MNDGHGKAVISWKMPTGPTDGDTDGVPDASDNCPTVSNATQTNTDRDGKGDACDTDDDNDGLSDGAERGSSFTCLSPTKKDSDGDLLGDGYERKGVLIGRYFTTNAGNPGTRYYMGRVKTNPCKKDSDADGLTDYREAAGSVINQRIVRRASDGGAYLLTSRKSHPMKRDTDNDGLTDKQEVTGSANARYSYRKTDPTSADTDWGYVKDGAEVKIRRSDPTRGGD